MAASKDDKSIIKDAGADGKLNFFSDNILNTSGCVYVYIISSSSNSFLRRGGTNNETKRKLNMLNTFSVNNLEIRNICIQVNNKRFSDSILFLLSYLLFVVLSVFRK